MSDLSPKVYYELFFHPFDAMFYKGALLDKSSIPPKFMNWDVEVASEEQENFQILGRAAPYLDLDSFKRLISASKSLHSYLASMQPQLGFTSGLQTITLSGFFGLMNAVQTLGPNEFLNLCSLRLYYTPSDSSDSKDPRDLRIGFGEIFIRGQTNTNVHLSKLQAKAPFLHTLSLPLDNYEELGTFVQNNPDLHFVKDLFLCTKKPYKFSAGYDKEAGLEKINTFKINPYQQKKKAHILTLLERCPDLERLVFKDDHFFPADWAGLKPNSLPKLKLLEIGSGMLTAEAINILLEAAPNLEELILSTSKFYCDGVFIGLTPRSLPRLTRVIMPYDYNDEETGERSNIIGNFGPLNIQAIKTAAPQLLEMRSGKNSGPIKNFL